MENSTESSMDYLFEENEASTSTGNTNLTREEKTKKEFRIRKDSNEEEIFRFINPKNTKKHYHETHFHEARVHGFDKKMPCPYGEVINTFGTPETNNFYYDNFLDKTDDLSKCPFCVRAKEFKTEHGKLDKNNEDHKADRTAWFKRLNKVKPRLYRIFEGVDRNRIGDGVKFWRIKHNFKKLGDWDTIGAIVRKAYTKKNIDFTNTANGFDVELTTVEDEYQGHKFKKIQAIQLSDSKPLHDKEDKINEFVNHGLSWQSVFQAETAPGHTAKEYMQAVLDGKAPKWDKNEKAWFVGDEKIEYEKKESIDNITDEQILATGDEPTDMGKLAKDVEKTLEKEVGDSNNDFTESLTGGENGMEPDELPF